MPVRHPGRWVAIAVLAVLGAMLVNTILTNDGFRWDVVGKYLFSAPVLNGLRNTLILTVLSMLIGIFGGIALAIMRLSPNPVLSYVAVVLHLAVPRHAADRPAAVLELPRPRSTRGSSLGIPFGPEFVSFDTNQLINQFTACLLGLGLNEAAYMAEIVRGGLQSVDHGQTEAAGALGMSRMQTLRRIVLPQAMRVIIPPTGNETISMLKTTSLVGRHRLLRAADVGAADLLGELPDDPAADRGRALVPGADVGALDRAGLRGAALRARGAPGADRSRACCPGA